MNGYEVMYFGAMAICAMGITVECLNRTGRWLGGKRYSTAPRYVRRWLPVTYVPHRQVIVVKVLDSGKRQLASYLNTVRDTPYARYDGLSYQQLLATVTPEEACKIQQVKEFLQ